MDYFWIGGMGNWSDITHWATTSGGNTQHNSVPSAADNVFFDVNSFTAPNQAVNVNNQNIFCLSMNWTGATGNPRFVGPAENSINIGGDFILIPNMEFAFNGNLRFDGNGVGSISCAGKAIQGAFEINGASSSMWTLQGDLRVDSSIVINGGGFQTNGFDVLAKNLHVFAYSFTTLDLSSSTIRLIGIIDPARRDDWELLPILGINTDNLTLNEGTSEIELTSRFPSVRIFGSNAIQLHDLTFSAGSGVSLFNYVRWSFQDFWSNATPNIRFNKLEFKNNGLLYSELMINTLLLSPAKSYKFENGRTMIIGSLSAQGQCSQPITLNTIRPSGFATLQFNQSQNLEYVNIRNIHALGTGTFTANNSADLGNTNGWTINDRAGVTLYWVGGTGNWSDPNNWSGVSGGAGGGCIPSPADAVIFDQNSFTGNNTVTIDAEDALCGDMTWQNISGAPIFVSTETENLNIFGSLKLHPNLDLNLAGDVYFLSNDQNETIDLTGNRFLRNVYFAGNGEWLFESDFETLYFVYFLSGHINTQSYTFTFETLASDNENDRRLSLNNSDVILRTERYYGVYIDIYSHGLNLDAGTSRITFEWSGSMYNGGRYEDHQSLQWHHIYFNSWGSIRVNSLKSRIKFLRFYGNGEITGEVFCDKTFLNPGFVYQFHQYDTVNDSIYIDTLDANGRCDASITISSFYKGDNAVIFSNRDQTGSNLIIEDIAYSGATFTATQSLDNGNTSGWIIDDILGRDLYWVGGSGDWEDPSHWSLISGGMGGQCIPTSRDNVFFDNQSFSGPDQYVETQTFYLATCRNFTWDGPPESTRFSRRNSLGNCCGEMFIYGSLNIQTPFLVDFYDIEFRGNEPEHFIHTSGVHIANYRFSGSGNRTLLDDWQSNYIWLNSGGLKTNSFDVKSGRMDIWAPFAAMNIDLDTSHILLEYDGNFNYGTINLYDGKSLKFDADLSTIELNHEETASIRWQKEFAFNNVIFSSASGTSYMQRIDNFDQQAGNVKINKLQFNNDAFVYGEHTIDSLLFANGRSYTLESGKVQEVVDHLQIRGNNCIQLRLKSTEIGNPSIIEKKSGQVDGDFIQMQDQIARGGADFYAGENSTDIANNTGWIFESAEEYVEFGLLGDDVVFCRGETSLTLNEKDLIGAIDYSWNNGSTSPQLIVTNPGVYWVQATYANDCDLIDTIYVLEAEDFQVELGPDQTLCQGEVLNVNGDLNLTGANYLWSDGPMDANRILDQAGIYKLTAELNGCTNEDSIILEYVEIPDFNLSSEGQVCEGDTVILDASINEVSVLWSTGSTDPVIELTESNIYWLVVSKEGCEASDTIELNFISPPVFELGNDTILCAGQFLSINYIDPVSEANYLWNDGIDNIDRDLSSTGTYTLTGSIGSCTFTDSLSLEVIDIPQLPLESGEQICAGEVVSLDATIPGASIAWSTGSTNPLIELTQSGEYWLRISKAGCDVVDTFVLNFTVPPQVDLGSDPEICAGESILLDASVEGATYIWSNGETTATINPALEITQAFYVVSSFGRCSSEDSILVNVKQLPTVSLGSDFSFCPNESFLLTVQTNAESIIWSDGNTDSEREFSQPGIYQVMAMLNGCSNDASVNASHFNTAFVDLGPDTLICDDVAYPIDISINNGSYTWSDGSTEGIRMLSNPGVYTVAVFDGNCMFFDEFVLSTRECIYFDLYAPNVFSPNDDGINDFYSLAFDPRLQINNFKFQIYNRWGSLLFESDDPSVGWDGSLNGQRLNSEVYVYKIAIEYIDDNGPGSYDGGGDVLLMK